jgi:hypothetical protein
MILSYCNKNKYTLIFKSRLKQHTIFLHKVLHFLEAIALLILRPRHIEREDILRPGEAILAKEATKQSLALRDWGIRALQPILHVLLERSIGLPPFLLQQIFFEGIKGIITTTLAETISNLDEEESCHTPVWNAR